MRAQTTAYGGVNEEAADGSLYLLQPATYIEHGNAVKAEVLSPAKLQASVRRRLAVKGHMTSSCLIALAR